VTVTLAIVPPFLNSINVSPSTKSLFVGDSFSFIATPLDQYGSAFPATMTWTSSNTTVGTVDSSGNFTALASGIAMVNATNGSVSGTAIVTVTSVPPVVQNLILNPGFESGTEPWQFYTNGIGSFTVDGPGYDGSKSAKIFIKRKGKNTQLYQSGIILEPNTRYRLTFDANSTSGNDLNVVLLKHVSPFTAYGLDRTFDLSKSWQEFSTEFTTAGFKSTVNDGRLMFWLAPFAAAGDLYYIDNVRLAKVSIPGIPTILNQPSDETVYEGQIATFTVNAKDTEPLTYQWMKNGVKITGAQSASYTTPPAVLSDKDSIFQVIVTNSVGSVVSNEARLTVLQTPLVNLVKNPGFETGTKPWQFYTNGIGAFTADGHGIDGSKSAKIFIIKEGKNTQLYQSGIILEPNTRYRLTFEANSTSGNDLNVALLKHVSPFTAYGLDKTFDLSKSWQEFSTEFTTAGFKSNVNDGRLMFLLAPFAAAGETYYIDNVRLEKI